MEKQQNSELFNAVVATPFGAMGVRTAGGAVVELVYLPAHYAEREARDRAAELAVEQIVRYCADADFAFSLPLAPLGSPFQRRVWETICAIPRGQVRTYGEVARHLGSAPRAVGQACGANWFPLAIP